MQWASLAVFNSLQVDPGQKEARQERHSYICLWSTPPSSHPLPLLNYFPLSPPHAKAKRRSKKEVRQQSTEPARGPRALLQRGGKPVQAFVHAISRGCAARLHEPVPPAVAPEPELVHHLLCLESAWQLSGHRLVDVKASVAFEVLRTNMTTKTL